MAAHPRQFGFVGLNALGFGAGELAFGLAACCQDGCQGQPGSPSAFGLEVHGPNRKAAGNLHGDLVDEYTEVGRDDQVSGLVVRDDASAGGLDPGCQLASAGPR
jgi:hypothetical protein